MAEIDTSIYKIAPNDPMTGVSNALSVANAAKQNQILGIQSDMLGAQNQQVQGNLQGQTQYGNALSGALRSDGTIDTAAANRAYIAGGGNPIYAPSAFNNSATLSGSNITNATTQSALNQTQMGESIARANAIASSGGKRADIMRSLNTDLSNGSLSLQAHDNIISGMPPSDKLAASYIRTRAIGTASPAAQASPTAAGADALGRSILKPAVDVATSAARPGGTVTEASPGIKDVAASNKKAIFEDQLRASNTMGNVRPLEQALPLIQSLSSTNFGPGSPEIAKLKGLLTMAGVLPATSTSLPTRQDANKYLLQYAAGAQAAGRSDAALSSALGSNPNLDLTQPANLALIKNQIARDRMDAAIPKAFEVEGKPGQAYSDFKNGYYQGHDQRAFQLDLMTPEERTAYAMKLGYTKGLGGKLVPPAPGSGNYAAFQKFANSHQVAKQAGMLQPGQGQ